MNPLSDQDQILDLIRDIAPLPLSHSQIDGLQGAALSLANWLERTRSPRQHPRIALFAGHGTGAMSGERDAAEKLLKDILGNNDGICRLAEAIDADLRVYELNMGEPHMLDGAGIIRALAYGMMAVEPGVDMIVVGGLGGGLDTVALENMKGLAEKDDDASPLPSIEPMAAIAGTITAARLANIPAILDGAAAIAALFFLCRINKSLADHCATAFALPPNIKQWFRENTKLQFMPPQNTSATVGIEGARLLQLAVGGR